MVVHHRKSLKNCLISCLILTFYNVKADETFMGNLPSHCHAQNESEALQKFYTPIRYAGLPKLKLSTSKIQFRGKIRSTSAATLGILHNGSKSVGKVSFLKGVKRTLSL